MDIEFQLFKGTEFYGSFYKTACIMVSPTLHLEMVEIVKQLKHS